MSYDCTAMGRKHVSGETRKRHRRPVPRWMELSWQMHSRKEACSFFFFFRLILLMEEILHQLSLVVHPIICQLLYIQKVVNAGFLPYAGGRMREVLNIDPTKMRSMFEKRSWKSGGGWFQRIKARRLMSGGG